MTDKSLAAPPLAALEGQTAPFSSSDPLANFRVTPKIQEETGTTTFRVNTETPRVSTLVPIRSVEEVIWEELEETMAILPFLLRLRTQSIGEETISEAERCSRESTSNDLEANGSSPTRTLLRA